MDLLIWGHLQQTVRRMDALPGAENKTQILQPQNSWVSAKEEGLCIVFALQSTNLFLGIG